MPRNEPPPTPRFLSCNPTSAILPTVWPTIPVRPVIPVVNKPILVMTAPTSLLAKSSIDVPASKNPLTTSLDKTRFAKSSNSALRAFSFASKLSIYLAFSLAAEPADSSAVLVASMACWKFWSTLANTLYWFCPARVSPNATRCASVIASHFGFNSDNTSKVLFKLPSVFSTWIPYSASASWFFTILAAIVDKPRATWDARPCMISVPLVTRPITCWNELP